MQPHLSASKVLLQLPVPIMLAAPMQEGNIIENFFEIRLGLLRALSEGFEPPERVLSE
jgi:hypothetical protein